MLCNWGRITFWGWEEHKRKKSKCWIELVLVSKTLSIEHKQQIILSALLISCFPGIPPFCSHISYFMMLWGYYGEDPFFIRQWAIYIVNKILKVGCVLLDVPKMCNHYAGKHKRKPKYLSIRLPFSTVILMLKSVQNSDLHLELLLGSGLMPDFVWLQESHVTYTELNLRTFA